MQMRLRWKWACALLATMGVFLWDVADYLSAFGCNAVVLVDGDDVAFGRNLDVPFQDGWWVRHQRGRDRVAYCPGDTGARPARWTSRYGSITINAYHTDLPLGGMNEEGLVVEHLAVRSAYPEPDGRPVLTPHQWVQCQLDTCSTVDEVVQGDTQVRITPWVFGFMHYLVSDARGNWAVIEYLPDGHGGSVRMVHRSAHLRREFAALGNMPYQAHVEFMRQFSGFGGAKRVPVEREELGRGTAHQFAWGAERLRQFYAGMHPDTPPVEFVFETIGRYRWGSTAISIVYEPASGRAHFITARNERRRTVDLREMDFSPTAPRAALAWDDSVAGPNWQSDIGAVSRRMIEAFCQCEGFGDSVSRLRRDYRRELERYSYDANTSAQPVGKGTPGDGAGMRTMGQSFAALVREGSVSLQTALAYSDDRQEHTELVQGKT
jgi:choloylglycine hydrolase